MPVDAQILVAYYNFEQESICACTRPENPCNSSDEVDAFHYVQFPVVLAICDDSGKTGFSPE